MHFSLTHILLYFTVLFFFTVSFPITVQASSAAGNEQRITIYYFHETICESCNPEEELLDILNSMDQNDFLPYTIEDYCIYSTQGRHMLENLSPSGTDYAGMTWPAVLIGNTWLEGTEQIRNGIAGLLTRHPSDETGNDEATGRTPFIGTGNESGQIAGSLPVFQKDSVNLLYFKTEACSGCEEAQAALDSLPSSVTLDGKEYPVRLTTLSIMEGNNANLLYSCYQEFQVDAEDQVVPILFVGDRYLSGAREIREYAAEYLAAGYGLGADYFSETEKTAPFAEAADLGSILAAGLLNGLNPCMLSMTLFFLSLLLTLPVHTVRCAFGFLTGKFVSYFLLGLIIARAASGLLYAGISGVHRIMAVFLLAFSIILAILNFGDFLQVRKGELGKIRLQLPAFLRRWNHHLMSRFVSASAGRWIVPAVFLASVLISAGELMCSGQIYLASILGWLQEADTAGVPLSVFLLYVTALCVPSALLILLCLRGKSLLQLSSASLKHMALIKFANVVLFLFMAWLAFRML